MRPILIGIIIILLIANLIPNFIMMRKQKQTGESNPRFMIMVGIDAILLILIVSVMVIHSL